MIRIVNSIKTFIKDIKWMFAIDKEAFKLLGTMSIFTILISIFMLVQQDEYIFLTLNLLPLPLFLMVYFSKYRPIFREIEESIRLRNKYSFLYNKFTKGE